MQNEKNTVFGKLQTAGQKAVPALLLVFVGYLFLHGFSAYTGASFLQAHQGKKTLIFLGMTALVFVVLFLKAAGLLFSKCSDRILRLLCILLPVGILSFQLFSLLYVRSAYLWDTAFVVGGADSLLQSGKITEEARYYLSVYPNQNTFVCITWFLLKVGRFLGLSAGGSVILLNLFNTFCLDLSLVFTALIFRRLKPAMTSGQWAHFWLFAAMNPFFYANVTYYYTITLSLPLLTGLLYLLLLFLEHSAKWKVLFLAAGAGIFLAAGYLIRATSVFPFLAFLVILFLTGTFTDRKENHETRLKAPSLWVGLGVMAGTAFLLVSVISAKEADFIGIDTTDTAFPATHWIMMSLTPPGTHVAEDEAYTAGFATREEKKEAVRERLEEKLNALGVKGYAGLLVKKVNATWEDGSDGLLFFQENALRTNGLYSYVLGTRSGLFMLYCQGYFLYLLLGMICSIGGALGKKSTSGRNVLLLQLTLLGAFVFYLLWETASQYSMPFMPVMMLLALEGSSQTEERFDTDRLWLGLGLLSAAGILIFALKNISLYTGENQNWSAPVVRQILANVPREVGDGEVLTQEFYASQPFNQVIFQWRNEEGEDNDAVYQVCLTDAEGTVLWEETIEAMGQPYQGAFQKQFQTVAASEEPYFLTLSKIGGSEGNTLAFVTYDCGGYDPYPLGKMSINGKDRGADLCLLVSEETVGPYVTAKRYGFILSATVIIFLFLSFCCKMRLSRNCKI